MSRWKRKLFFGIERLQISPEERIIITILFGLVLLLSGTSLFLKQRYAHNEESYAAVLAEFEARSRVLEAEKAENEKRYLPQPAAAPQPKEITAPPAAAEQTADAGVHKSSSGKPDAAAAVNGVNINTAGIAELTALPGIGPVYAQRIVDYRSEYGNFKTADDLLNIKGIGEKTLEKLKPYIIL